MTKLRGPRNRLSTTWRFMRDPFVCYRQWRRKYGETFLVRALNGNVVATSNLENIRRIFALPTESLTQFAVGTVQPLVGGSSIFLVDGQQHRKERAILSPSFHGSRIDGQANVIREITMRLANNLEMGSTFRVMDLALDLSLEVIIRVVFGVQSDERVQRYSQSIKEFVSSFHPTLAFSRLLHRPLFGLSPWNRFVKARRMFRDLLLEDIRERRKLADHREAHLLSRLLSTRYEDGSEITDEVICDHLISALLAGHETTQIAIAWGMSWLHRHPKVLERLRAELNQKNSLNDVANSEYLLGVCNESLRLNSVVSDIIRTVTQPLELEEFSLPANSNVAVAICLVHENAKLYPDPFMFQPERWDGVTRKPHEFLPFGGGIRRCLGATLAMLEMKIAIATLVTQFRFELPKDVPEVEPVYRRNITMAPKSGIPLVFVGRANGTN